MAARRVIARSDVTLMDAAVFDTMMSALDRPDESIELAELAKLPKLIDRSSPWISCSAAIPNASGDGHSSAKHC